MVPYLYHQLRMQNRHYYCTTTSKAITSIADKNMVGVIFDDLALNANDTGIVITNRNTMVSILFLFLFLHNNIHEQWNKYIC